MTHRYRTQESKWSIHNGEEPTDSDMESPTAQEDTPSLLTHSATMAKGKVGAVRPQGRYGHRCVQASYWNKNVMLMFGGYNCEESPRRLDDLWEYDLDRCTWEKIEFRETSIVPPARDCHGAVLYKNEMYVVAGGTGFVWLDDMYAYNVYTRTWRMVHCTGETPSGRAGHSANVYGDKMIVFAGWDGRRTLNDLHMFDFETCHWEKIEYKGLLEPESRDSHTAVVVNGCLYVTGGGDGRTRLNDMWEFNIERRQWNRFDCMGGVNAGRAGHVCCLYMRDSEAKIIMFGGGNGDAQGGWLIDIYECDLNARKWTLIETPEEDVVAPGCYGLSAIIFKNHMFVFGGGDGENWYNTVYRYTIDESLSKKRMKNNMMSSLQRRCFANVELICQDSLPYGGADDDDCQTEMEDAMMLDSDNDSSMHWSQQRSPIPEETSTSTSKALTTCAEYTRCSKRSLEKREFQCHIKRSRVREPGI